MDSLTSSSGPPFNSREGSPSTLPPITSSRHTSHYRNAGGLSYGLGVAWTHLRPFLPFILISCLVVLVVYLLQTIIYGGPFTDPLFFTKFDQRWPPPGHQNPTSWPGPGSWLVTKNSQNVDS